MVRDSKDHPHAYGDKKIKAPSASGLVGSSPRVWGQVNTSLKSCRLSRIIPTRMGTRQNCAVRKYGNKDHPHAYGDKLVDKYSIYFDEGSSPRVWGQAPRSRGKTTNLRIIPTRMGTSFPLCMLTPCRQDHPHAYGDKKNQPSVVAPFLGSSPRVWGQVTQTHTQYVFGGIIPTRMGTSQNYEKNGTKFEDHPHAYGDKNNLQR